MNNLNIIQELNNMCNEIEINLNSSDIKDKEIIINKIESMTKALVSSYRARTDIRWDLIIDLFVELSNAVVLLLKEK